MPWPLALDLTGRVAAPIVMGEIVTADGAIVVMWYRNLGWVAIPSHLSCRYFQPVPPTCASNLCLFNSFPSYSPLARHQGGIAVRVGVALCREKNGASNFPVEF
jgi:hypothetical protein